MPLSTINNKSIADGTIVATDILDGTISSSKLVSANIAGDRLAANTLSNTVFQTGSVESYMRSQTLDFGMRNRIINGAMRIDQRNAGASVSTAGSAATYTLDRWFYFASQAAKFTVQQDSSANTVAGFTSSLKVVSTSSYSVGSSEIFHISQHLEGHNVADLRWGTANARPVTLSFSVRSSLTGTFGGALRNDNSDRSYPFSYTITVADTWEQKFITIPGDTSGTWFTTNGTGIRLTFGLGMGSSFSGTAGAWAGANYISSTGATSVVGTNAATWYVTGVQLEEGSVPTPFEYRQYGTELALCQRYFWISTSSGGDQNQRISSGIAYNASSTAQHAVMYPVEMRTTPTINSLSGTYIYNPVIGGKNITSVTLVGASSTGATLSTAGSTGLTNQDNWVIFAATINFSAEL